MGVAIFTFENVTTQCYDSAQQQRAGGGDGGTPGWVWAVVGTALGLAALAAAGGACYLHRRRRQLAQQEAALEDEKDKASHLSELGSQGLVGSQGLGGQGLGSGALAGGPPSGDARGSAHRSGSGEMASAWMRTRCGLYGCIWKGGRSVAVAARPACCAPAAAGHPPPAVLPMPDTQVWGDRGRAAGGAAGPRRLWCALGNPGGAPDGGPLLLPAWPAVQHACARLWRLPPGRPAPPQPLPLPAAAGVQAGCTEAGG